MKEDYKDINGNPVSLEKLVKEEPDWACSRIRYYQGKEVKAEEKPRVVCICGSTRFADQHAIIRWELEQTGEYICLMINYLPADYAEKELGKLCKDNHKAITKRIKQIEKEWLLLEVK